MAQSIITDSITFKVLVVGSFGVGKTTLIQQISDVPVIGTEVATTGSEAVVKSTTTVGVEYGLFSVGDEDSLVTLLLFGTPGQDRFFVARDVASRGIDGLVVIVDGDDPTTWPLGRSLYETYSDNGQLSTAVVVNRWDAGAEPPQGLVDAIGIVPETTVILCGNVVEPEEVRRFLVELLCLILEQGFDDEDEETESERELAS